MHCKAKRAMKSIAVFCVLKNLRIATMGEQVGSRGSGLSEVPAASLTLSSMPRAIVLDE